MLDRYAELFLTESREHLSTVNEALLTLEQGSATAEPVHALFRAVHTVKGMAGAMGFTAAADVAHELESLLALVRDGAVPIDGEVLDALFAASDVLEDSIAAAIEGADGGVDGTAAVERMRALASRAASRTASSATASTSAGDTAVASGIRAGRAGSVIALRVQQERGTPLPGVRALLVLKRLQEHGEVVATEPSEEALHQLEQPASFTVYVRTSADLETLRAAAMQAGGVARLDDLTTARPLTPPSLLAEPPGSEPPGSDPDSALSLGTSPSGSDPGSAPSPGRQGAGDRDARAAGGSARSAGSRSVRVELRRLDVLLDLAGELVIARGRLQDAGGAHADTTLRDAVQHLSRLIGTLQEEVLTTRLVPVWQVFDRFPRFVRDTARALGKDVEFVVEGQEIELDRSLLDEIGDPVLHVLRNALDHGLETPSERRAAGKPATGRLTLSAVRDRDAVLIRIADDGRGIDRRKVQHRAHALGLLAEERELTDEEVIRLISRAGFSTADRVTDVSGRGVGVDAVQTRLQALGGSVDIASHGGGGTTVTLRLPLTLAIVRTLLTRVGDEVYALPASHVAATAELQAARLATVRGEPVVMLGEEVMPALDLRELVGLPPRTDGRGERELVVLDAQERRVGLLVDEVTGQQEAVVKRFDAARGGLGCFSGATILGNGMPALIVDVGRLLT